MCYNIAEQKLLNYFVPFSDHEAFVMPHPNARQRRQWITWYFAHGQDVTATCRQFGISRPTFYRWLARYTAAPTKPLHARRLHTRRQPTWSTYELRILCEFLGRYPTLGRGRLTQAINRVAQAHWSPATVGRMLRQMQPRCPICRGRNGRHIHVNPFLRQDLYQLTIGALLPPGLRPPPDPEVDFVIREAEAAVRTPED